MKTQFKIEFQTEYQQQKRAWNYACRTVTAGGRIVKGKILCPNSIDWRMGFRSFSYTN